MKKWITPNTLILFVLTVALVHLHACNSTSHKPKKSTSLSRKTYVKAATATVVPPETVAHCDSAAWAHVYDPSRLQVLERCKVVTGTIAERNADPDGDEHMLLRLDNGQEQLLYKKNHTKKEGNLVVEVVCVNGITRKRALGACTGYVNNVQLPHVGDHVRVTGSYVIDSRNGWTEIHPASKIETIN